MHSTVSPKADVLTMLHIMLPFMISGQITIHLEMHFNNLYSLQIAPFVGSSHDSHHEFIQKAQLELIAALTFISFNFPTHSRRETLDIYKIRELLVLDDDDAL